MSVFNYIDKGKALGELFDTDRIIKIGEATQDPPIPCHLYVKDTQLFSMQTEETPIFVYGELYTDISVPTISQNVRLEKVNPKTGEVLAFYEGTPSRPIVGQSRKKYAVRFFDAVTPEYPKIVNVLFWDFETRTWVDADPAPLTIELLDDKRANPKDGFNKVQDEFGSETWQIKGTKIKMNSYPYFYPLAFKIEGEEFFFSVSSPAYGSPYTWDYIAVDDPDTGLATEFGVDYYTEFGSWEDTGGIIKLSPTEDKFTWESGFSNQRDEFGSTVIKIDKLGITIPNYQDFYLREQGGTQRILECEFGYPIDVRYEVSYRLVDRPRL